MEKRRIRLEINGVVCGLITQESEEYMQSLAGEVGDLMKEILAASPFITREAAALTAALSYCDDAKKNGVKAARLNDRVEELEVEAEIWQEDKEKVLAQAALPGQELQEKLETLQQENARLSEAVLAVAELEGKVRRLSDENTALREAAREEEERVKLLTHENVSLREEAKKIKELKNQTQNLEEKDLASQCSSQRIVELEEQVKQLTSENALLRETGAGADTAAEAEKATQEKGTAEKKGNPQSKWKNPLRHEELDQLGLVSFFEKGEGGKKR